MIKLFIIFAMLASFEFTQAHAFDQCDLKNLTEQLKKMKAESERVSSRPEIQKAKPALIQQLNWVESPASLPQSPIRSPDSLDFKIKLSQMLEPLQLSDRFKMALIANSDAIPSSLGEDQQDKAYPIWPWPPENPKAGFARVKPSEFKVKMKALLGEVQYQEFADLFPSQFSFASLEEIEPTHLSSEKEKRIFNFVTEQFVKLVKAGRADSDLGSSDKDLILKIQSVRLLSYTEKDLFKKACTLDFGAKYDPSGHFAVICGEVSEAGAIKDLSKQMAKIVEPCSSQFALYEVNISEFKKMLSQSEGIEGSKNFPFGFYHICDQLLKGAELTGLIDGEVFDNELSDGDEIRKLLIQKGVLKEKIAGTEFLQYPFKMTLSCYSTGAQAYKSPSDSQFQNFVSDSIRQKQNKAGSFYSAESERKTLLQALQKHPHCNRVGPMSQMNEVMNTWASARIVDQYFKEHPEKESLSAFADVIDVFKFNASDKQSDGPFYKETVKEAITALEDSSFELRERQKIEAFYLKASAIRKVLSCKDEAVTNCLGSFESELRRQHKSTGVSK